MPLVLLNVEINMFYTLIQDDLITNFFLWVFGILVIFIILSICYYVIEKIFHWLIDMARSL